MKVNTNLVIVAYASERGVPILNFKRNFTAMLGTKGADDGMWGGRGNRGLEGGGCSEESRRRPASVPILRTESEARRDEGVKPGGPPS